jgi:lipoate-protein ligase A
MALWYLLDEPAPFSAHENMARDEYLFNICHRRRCGFFRLYQWLEPTFSLGVSQPVNKAVDHEELKRSQCSLVRRVTGGKTVLHHRELTYAVVSSEEMFFEDNDLMQSYRLISTALVNGFQKMGINAYLSKGSPSILSKSNNPCFSFPTPNELEVDGKKIVGSAQKRDNQALLQHGSIPLAMDYDLYARVARFHPRLLQRSMTTLSELTEKGLDDLKTCLISSFSDLVGAEFIPFTWDRIDDPELYSRLCEKYASDDWNLSL